MKQITIALLISLIFIGCTKSNYTGFNGYKATENNRITSQNNQKLTEIFTTNLSGPKLEASLDNSLPESTLSDHLMLAAENEQIVSYFSTKSNTKTVAYSNKKITFKEKLVNKFIAKKIMKSSNINAKPNGFNNLDGKLKIGIILLAVAIGLSILGFGQLSGLAALIGLIFLILGLVNTYG